MDLTKYQVPDGRWSFFGFESLEHFCDANLVHGRFHSSVPSDVVEAYTVCEYIMIYSYYHYPLYYEAFSKVLRTIEMAVKIRCKQKDIPTKKIRERDQVVFDRKLSELMNDLSNSELVKELSKPFENTRNIRNIVMHPESHTYTGAMTMYNMKFSVGLLNKIFIEEQHFLTNKKQLEVMHQKVASFKDSFFILQRDSGNYLVMEIQIKDVIQVSNQWIYLLAAIPVMLNPKTNLTEHLYIKPLTFHVIDINVTAGIFTCTKLGGDTITVVANDNPENNSHYLLFKNVLNHLDDHDKWLYENNNQSEIEKEQIDFAYLYLHAVTEMD